MNLKTEIKLPKYSFDISHGDKIISFGSCFSENIGEKLIDNKFDVCINPFGILFNPISVSKAINDCVSKKDFSEKDLNSNEELFFSFNHHSKFSGLDKNDVLERINNSIDKAHTYLHNSSVLIITIGTAWIYRKKSTNEVVANCYKLQQNEFDKELLSINKVVKDLNESFKLIREINPTINIITTISPVRHWKDGEVENQQSKATLHLALKEINESNEKNHYFPSYEIMMDELRDYRFYAKDMLHPSEIAIDYIWEKFSSSLFTKETQDLNSKIIQITQAVNHKPFNSESENHKKFQQNILNKIQEIEKDHPTIDFTEEKAVLLI